MGSAKAYSSKKNKPKKAKRHRGKSKAFSCHGTFAGADPIAIIRVRAQELKLPKSIIEPCIKDIERWYLCSGSQWTVDRLKYIKQCAIRLLTMGEYPISDGKNWLAKSKNGNFRNHWGGLLNLFKQQPNKVAIFLQCYTVFAKGGDPSVESINKYKDTLEKPFEGEESELNRINQLIEQSVEGIVANHSIDYGKDVCHKTDFLLEARVNNPIQLEDLLWKVQDFLTSKFGHDMIEDYPWILESLGIPNYQLTPWSEIEKFYEGLRAINPSVRIKPFVAAKINFINEPGLKERIVADYAKVLEFLTWNFGKRLYDIVKQLPWDATYYEESAYKQIKHNFASGKYQVVKCFDLHSATDRFPLSLQAAVIRAIGKLIGPNFCDEAELFLASCKQPVELPDGQLTSWSVGQPMGAYPSFAMFTLSHGMACMAYLHSQGQKYHGQFLVHGDDIIIFDGALANWYENTLMPAAGAPLNMFKTIASQQYGEFNSRLITAKRIIRFPKWRPITPASLPDQVATWGVRAVYWTFLSKRKIEAAKRLLAIPYFFLPNGNSLNPEGLSEEERFNAIPEPLLQEILYPKPVKKDFISNRALVLQRFHADSLLNLQLDGKPYELSDSLGTLYLQMLCSALDKADTLDREILQDSIPFMKFMNGGEPLEFVLQNTIPYHYTDLCFSQVSDALNEFHEVFGHEDMVQFGYIKQRKTDNKYSQPRLAKYVNRLLKSHAV